MKVRPETAGVPKGLCQVTLRWCNKMRKKQGLKPLKRLPAGERRDPLQCPCGLATGLAVYSDEAAPRSDRAREKLGEWKVFYVPAGVRHFIERFDMSDGKGP